MTENKKSGTSQTRGQSKNSNNEQRRRRRRRRPSKKPEEISAKQSHSNNQAKEGQRSTGKSQSFKNKPGHQNKNNIKNGPKNKKRNHSRNQRRKPIKNHEVIEKYDNLMNLHLQARKKYFENFHKKDQRHVEKLERNFNRTAMDVRAYERKLNERQKEILNKRIDGYPLDKDYSLTSQEQVVIDLPTPPYSDPHLNLSQKSRPSFTDDNQETIGTMEDYEKYKEEREKAEKSA